MAPEIRLTEVNSFCSLGPKPHLLTGLLRQWLIQHFGKPETIENLELRQRIWRDNPATGIEVESITRWKPSTTEKRPAIILKRNDWKIVRAGIDDRLMGGPNLGTDYFAAYIEGSHTLFCLSSLATEAELLACEVYRELMRFGPALREHFSLHRFLVMGVGALNEIEEAKENYAVPITVAYMAEERWELIPHAPFLKTIAVDTGLV